MRLGVLLVIGAATILYFIGAGNVSLWDRDEAWYAQTSRQMMESGDWVVPRFLDAPRYAKPIFIYWCQAASMKFMGATPLAARLPSALAMMVLAVFDVGRDWKKLSAWKSAIAWWRRLRPLIGLVIIVCVVAPWLIMLYLRERGALRAMLGEPLRHLTSDQDSQWVYPGYYLVTIWLTYFPWSLLLPAGLVYGWRRRRDGRVRFALATILGNWVFVEMMITKLPHYMLPSFSS